MKLFKALLAMGISLSTLAQDNTLDAFRNMNMRSIGPAVTSGRVTAIDVLDTDLNVIYVGTASGGLWKSADGGLTWEPLFDKQPVQGIGAVAIAPSNPDVIWAGTGEGNPRNSHTSGAGIFKSLDGGRTWERMGLEETRTLHRVIVHPTETDIVYAGAPGSIWGPNPERGVFKTTDGGKNWNKILFVNDSTGCADLVMDPRNPDKLFAAMWQFQRKPWTFNSGGPGSGLHMTLDGGKTWKKLTSKQGLPEGNLGRIGLAISPSNPNVVYALIESNKTGLYRSTDGGFNWSLVTNEHVDDRPFYYHEIYVDPANEHHLFYLHSTVSESIDGGKSWNTLLPYWGVHPDHHAMWISHSDPLFMVEGNDGGLNISRDGGKNWQFINNLPLGQFYHINVDNDVPYHVYGGMQDNGSWVGPGFVWHEEGIRDADWLEVAFGDGFDVVPNPEDSRFVYAMSQGGYLSHIDTHTGRADFIRPEAEGVQLRFNWNAGISDDPFNPYGLYYGSQFLHHSPDRGLTWDILSPDLTTNDTTKLKQHQSGGLTIDATGAENHCTILCIAPDPKDARTIWVGTDDGNVQLTTNRGESWTNLSKTIPGWPANGWVCQINVSPHNSNEVYVVVNNYRQNDWKPYLFVTTDKGKTWKNLVDPKKVSGHSLSFAQDPEVANLLFLGTENGLYVSFDKGANWHKWMHDYPSVATQDIKIQKGEGDLVIGTFGRAAYVLDAIHPLRERAKEGARVLEQKLTAFDSPPGYMVSFSRPKGQRFPADHYFEGENKSPGAMLQYHFRVEPAAEEKPASGKKEDKKQDKKGKEQAAVSTPAKDTTTSPPAKPGEGEKEKKTIISILSENGDTLRVLRHEPDTGLNRLTWWYDTRGQRWPSRRERKADDKDQPGGGPSVKPGKYKAVFQYQEHKDSCMFEVKYDPRLFFNEQADQRQRELRMRVDTCISRADRGFENLKSAKGTIELVKKSLVNVNDSLKKDILASADSLLREIKDIEAMYMTPEGMKGISDIETRWMDLAWSATSHIDTGNQIPGGNALVAVMNLEKKTSDITDKINALFEQKWKAWRAEVEKLEKPLFKDYTRL